jgi:hypothetical protein
VDELYIGEANATGREMGMEPIVSRMLGKLGAQGSFDIEVAQKTSPQ